MRLLSVARPHEAVGEAQAVHDPCQRAVRRAAINPPGRHVLDDVLLPFTHVVAHRRHGEEKIAAGRGHDVAAKDESLPTFVCDKRRERAGLEIEFQQAFRTVADEKPPVRRRFETQRAPAGVGHLPHRPVLGRDRDDAPIKQPGVDHAFRPGHDVLRPLAGQGYEGIGRQRSGHGVSPCGARNPGIAALRYCRTLRNRVECEERDFVSGEPHTPAPPRILLKPSPARNLGADFRRRSGRVWLARRSSSARG